jgi:hypothetical protein
MKGYIKLEGALLNCQSSECTTIYFTKFEEGFVKLAALSNIPAKLEGVYVKMPKDGWN